LNPNYPRLRNVNTAGVISGLIILVIFLTLPPPAGMPPAAFKAAGIALLMTVWWITEAIPIAATALIPLVLFPLTGVLTAGKTAENYGHNYVLMLLAGFILAKSFEVHHLHKRIALGVIRIIGHSRRTLLLSFMIATALLSMWIANVAVALMMLPIGLAIIREENEQNPGSKFGLALMLSISYAASIGGTGTLIGTPPNMVLTGLMDKLFPASPGISFLDWLKIGIPMTIIFIPVIWIYLTRYFRVSGNIPGGRELIARQWEELGKITPAQKRIGIIFIITALAWIFRRDIVLDHFVIPGWGSLLGVASYVHDATVAVTACILLFLIPSGNKNNRKEKLMDWTNAERVPWGVVIIVGGGYAIAQSFQETGLADWLGKELMFIGNLPAPLILFLVVIFMIFLTEINSNTATANIFLPVLAVMAVSGGIHPYLLLIPATMACSFAFMLPSGTGTNAVIFGSGQVTIREMSKAGLWLNLISVVIITLVMYLLAVPVFHMAGGIPEWAR